MLTAADHFQRCLSAAIAELIDVAAPWLGGEEAAFREFAFLQGYREECAQSRWSDALADEVTGHSPIHALRRAGGLDEAHLRLLFLLGLLDEDDRFGMVFDAFQSGGGRRPTAGLVGHWWPERRAALRDLEDLGLVAPQVGASGRAETAYHVPLPLWEAMRGDRAARPAPWARLRAPHELAPLDGLLLPAALRAQVDRLPQASAVVVRGPARNGRMTLLGALAARAGCGLLEIEPGPPDDPRWRQAGPLATALHAWPALRLDLMPGEIAKLQTLQACDKPIAIAMGPSGGLSGAPTETAITLRLPLPEPGERLGHWAAAGATLADPSAVARRFRYSAGNIRRAARLASSVAALDGRAMVQAEDVLAAGRALSRAALETLATPLDPAGGWEQLAVSPQTGAELATLERRCRHRETLREAVGPALRGLGPGVRALLTGPSGTGKTLAARLLAGALDMDVYRLDLAAVVNKYIGETEKSLNQILSRAEELDVLLLLDEGDALMTKRTGVSSANDRYANLETNYLLQRLDSFEGILLVTTNAADRIDGAFLRRMDVVVEFQLPEAEERGRIWLLHLNARHQVDARTLDEIAARCRLSGGQIRNAALHAALLALEAGAPVRREHLLAAVQREYRKLGQPCPLRASEAR